MARWCLICALLLACGADAEAPRDAGVDSAGSDSDVGDVGVRDERLDGFAEDARADRGAPDEGVPGCEVDTVSDGFCEAGPGSRCFYVDPVRGEDAADGSWDAPFRTMANLNRSIYGRFRPAGWVELAPGDVVYLRGGVHDSVYHPGDDDGPDGGGSFVLHFDRAAPGAEAAPIRIRGYPGEHAIVDGGGEAVPLMVQGGAYFRISDLEIRNGWERGVRLSNTSELLIERVLVHDTDGTVANNVAGLEILGSENVEVRQSAFIDNYDRAAAEEDRQTHNSCNAVAFGGNGHIRIHHSVFAQTREAPFSGCGFKYKHAARDREASFELDHNYFENHAYAAVGMGTANAHVHHNVVVGAPVAFSSIDWGGPTHQENQRFEYNTVVDARAIAITPTLDWVDHTGGPWRGFEDVSFTHNVVHDRTESPSAERRTVLINPYISNALHDAAAEGAAFDHNCYWADEGVTFGIAEDEREDLGGGFELAAWQSRYGWDIDSRIADPRFTADFRPGEAACEDAGAFADSESTPTSVESVLRCLPAGASR